MDISKRYIRMLEAAFKSEGIREDWIKLPYRYKIGTVADRGTLVLRQDQLQQIMLKWIQSGKSKKWKPIIGKSSDYKIIDLLLVFNRWVPVHIEQFRSLEKLWLAFLMEEKYDKIWKAGKWQKKND